VSGQPQVAEALRRGQASRLVPLYDSVEEALEEALARPAYLRDELRLAPIPTAAAVARAFVREVCQTWQLARPDETVVDRAVLVANELVTNAVVHAGSDLWLQLELRVDRLFISVRDTNPRLLRSVPPDLEADGGRGLWLVDQLARAWGVRPTPDGGKTVWCALSL
jgi:anti-sigma regulatory factor (Ser/Thr protein kinase)